MKPILIIGPEDSGKSRLAIDLVGEYGSPGVVLYPALCLLRHFKTIQEELKYDMDWMSADTKTVVFDDAPVESVKQLIQYFSEPTVKINRRMLLPLTVASPQIVITVSCTLADLDLSAEERKGVTIFETSVNPDNYLQVQIHETNRIEGVDPYYYMSRTQT